MFRLVEDVRIKAKRLPLVIEFYIFAQQFEGPIFCFVLFREWRIWFETANIMWIRHVVVLALIWLEPEPTFGLPRLRVLLYFWEEETTVVFQKIFKNFYIPNIDFLNNPYRFLMQISFFNVVLSQLLQYSEPEPTRKKALQYCSFG